MTAKYELGQTVTTTSHEQGVVIRIEGNIYNIALLNHPEQPPCYYEERMLRTAKAKTSFQIGDYVQFKPYQYLVALYEEQERNGVCYIPADTSRHRQVLYREDGLDRSSQFFKVTGVVPSTGELILRSLDEKVQFPSHDDFVISYPLHSFEMNALVLDRGEANDYVYIVQRIYPGGEYLDLLNISNPEKPPHIVKAHAIYYAPVTSFTKEGFGEDIDHTFNTEWIKEK